MQELKSFVRNRYENLKGQAPPAEERSKKATACIREAHRSRAGWFRPARGEPYRRWKCECGRNFQFRPDTDGKKQG